MQDTVGAGHKQGRPTCHKQTSPHHTSAHPWRLSLDPPGNPAHVTLCSKDSSKDACQGSGKDSSKDTCQDHTQSCARDPV
jgi:hypothetical protein